jgi:hypothetical protein
MLKKINPVDPAPLKYQNEILRLRNELAPLLKLEESAKGRLLSVKETQSLARKDEILTEISRLENDSRGWFEDDDSFIIRVERCKAAGRTQAKSKKVSSSQPVSASSTTRSIANPWVSAASRTVKTTTKRTPTTQAKPTGSGGVFAAMMMDDSDEE